MVRETCRHEQLLVNHNERLNAKVLSNLRILQYNEVLALEKGKLKELELGLDSYRVALNEATERYQELRIQARSALLEAKKSVLGPEEKATFESQLPRSVEELDALLESETRLARLRHDVSPAVVDQYKKLLSKIDELKKDLHETDAQIQRKKADMRRLELEWVPKVERMAVRLNVAFKGFFERLDCAGEIQLSKFYPFLYPLLY